MADKRWREDLPDGYYELNGDRLLCKKREDATFQPLAWYCPEFGLELIENNGFLNKEHLPALRIFLARQMPDDWRVSK